MTPDAALAGVQEVIAGELLLEARAQDRKASIAARHVDGHVRIFWQMVEDDARHGRRLPAPEDLARGGFATFSVPGAFRDANAWEKRRLRAESRAADCRRWATSC